MNNLEPALKYLKTYHFSVIPCGKNKKALIPWEEYQKRLPTEEEVTKWFTDFPEAQIGIVTGIISGICVVDLDDSQAEKTFNDMVPESLLMPTVYTPRGGKHHYFKCTDPVLTNKAMMLGTKMDFRANGGYVLAPPSTNGKGNAYSFIKGLSIKDIAIPALPNNVLSILSSSLKQQEVCQPTNNNLQNLTKSNIILQDGRRDNDLFHIANCLIKNKTPDQEVWQVLEILAKNCIPPFPENEIKIKIESALKRVARRERNLAHEILQFLNLTKGYINLTELYNTLQILTKEEKSNVYVIMNRLVKDKIIERFGNKNGQFRKIESEIEYIDWYDADEKAHIPISYPLDLHEYVLTLPKNVVVIAGSKDAGKTCFLLNVACMNLKNKLPIYYFSSEMGEVEMKKRLVKMSNRLHISLEDMKNKINWIDRSGDFADVIFPEALNIIDFLEITKDFYEVGDMMKNIYHKLTTGVVVIGIQKPSSRDMPIGGEKGLEKARIAIAIDNGKAKILVGKNWATDYNPRGLECRFKIIDGSEIRMAEPWGKKEVL